MRRLLLPVLLLAVPFVGACGASEGPVTPVPGELTEQGPAEASLEVSLDRGDGGSAETRTLTCEPEPGGTYADPAAVCDHLQGLEDPFAPLPADQMCTQQFGGPQTATVTGRWAGEPVDLQLDRTDGCAIAQWDRLGPLLPADVD
ncbi:SSI family serine proteinase inhibitor [uncultured Modestobacter sp.]|uniref:SSI family serine proteinase inhibitor n=1 Tax=uncultured Modestobacter sp. TaxID=380048 RepID=UPI002609CFC1|nr:SSI family serine proteinase inhibitor [uncultured Modestobacter sp.]